MYAMSSSPVSGQSSPVSPGVPAGAIQGNMNGNVNSTGSPTIGTRPQPNAQFRDNNRVKMCHLKMCICCICFSLIWFVFLMSMIFGFTNALTWLTDWFKTFEPYQVAALDYHNARRKEHQVGTLSLSTPLNELAMKCAEQYARWGSITTSRCTFLEDFSGDENEYITRTSEGDLKSLAVKACKSWYDQVDNYNFRNPGSYYDTRKFIAMVWKDSSRLGVAAYESGNIKVVVALYRKGGGYDASTSELNENVLRKKY